MPTTARYQLEGSILPPVQATLPLAESARRAIMSKYRQLKEFDRYGKNVPPDAERFASRVFSGKSEDGNPLRGDHEHAFYLPTDEDGDGRLDHLTVFAQGGFPRDEVRALDALRWLRCGDLELSLLLVGLGQQSEFRHTPVFGLASTWISATPFLVTRHLKRRGRKRDPREFFETAEGRVEFVKQVVREELERRALPSGRLSRRETTSDDLRDGRDTAGSSALGSPHSVRRPPDGVEIEVLQSVGPTARQAGKPDLQEGVEIEVLESVGGQHALRPVEFCLRRIYKPGDDGQNRPRGFFRLRFPEPVSGPIALGHSCHFGLGLFLPEK